MLSCRRVNALRYDAGFIFLLALWVDVKSDSNGTAARESAAQRQALKRRFGMLYDEVLAIITRHDPIGIAEVPDEYEPEVGAILRLLEQIHSVAELRRAVHQEFIFWFSVQVAGPESRYDNLARDIWDAWQARRPALRDL